MSKWMLLGSLGFFLIVAQPANSAEQQLRPSVPEEINDAWERFQQALEDWGVRFWGSIGSRGSREGRPVISQMLNNKEALGLSADQVRKLEQLRDGFQRQSIRTEADLKIVELDIAAMLENDAPDMAKLEAKVRQGEKMRADLRIARIRAIEQARGLLSKEQKKKLQELDPQPFTPGPPRSGRNPPAKEKE